MENNKTEPMKKRRGILAALAAALCFSIGGLCMKLIPWNALAINGSRNLIACCVIGLYIRITGHRLRINAAVLAGAVCIGSVTTLFVIANKLTTAGNAIIMQYTEPVWAMLLMYLFFKKKPGRKEIFAIVIVLAGIVFFFFDSLGSGRMLGDMLALLSGIFYAGMFMLNRFEKGDQLSSMFFGQILTGVLLTPALRGETDFSPRVIVTLVILGVVQVAVAYIFLAISLTCIDPVKASVICTLEPILNPIWVAVFYGEVLGPLAIAGGIIVVAGILYYNIRSAPSS